MSWPDTYLEASFRGVPFDFISTGEEVSRATVAHSYPFRDGAEVEDLGLNASRHTVRAILFGADADARLKRLKSALDAPGVGELSHPVYGALQVVVDSYHPAFDAEATDSVALDITFIENALTVHVFDLAIPEAKIDALTKATDDTFAAASNAFAQKIRNILALANNNRLTQLVATVSQTMAQISQVGAAVQNTVQSYLDMPTSLMSDMRSMMGALTPHLDASSLNNLLSGSSAFASTQASVQNYSSVQSQLTVATTFSAVPAGTQAEIQQDTALIAVNAQLVATLTLTQTAQAVLAAELSQPTATPLQIEAMANSVRDHLQVQIDALTALYPLELSRPIVESLKNTALLVQQAAQLVIETRPPLVIRQSPVSGNFRLVAHAMYGDHTRAPELARLNPLIRQPNFIQQGDALNAFAQ